jgi:putative hydrolase of the HAD superfamily
LPGAADAVWALRDLGHRVVLVTKGDLLDQERKLEKSGLAEAFDHVEIISEKNVAKYAELLRGLGCPPERFLMVGNSIRSDIVPVIELGARAVHVPYHLIWEHEHVGSWSGHPNVVEIANLSELPALLSSTTSAL